MSTGTTSLSMTHESAMDTDDLDTRERFPSTRRLIHEQHATERRLEMLARTAVVAVIAVVFCTMFALPAAAGGYAWVDWDKRYNAVGGISVGSEKNVLFRTNEAARRALTGETPYFVYLDDDTYRWIDRWHGPGRDGIRVGRIQVSENSWGSNIVTARAEFEVPQLASDTYTAYFCDAGCRHVMGDLYPNSFVVVQSPLEGRLRARMARMQQGMRSTARELRRQMGDTTRQAEARERDIRIDLAQDLNSRTNDLDRRIDRTLGIARDRNALRDSAAWFAAGFAAAVALAFIIQRRRRGPAGPSLEDELAELTADHARMPVGSRG
jgi:hypothetical protein